MLPLNSVSLLLTSAIVFSTGNVILATTLSDRIESSAKKSYVFMTYLKDDAIKITTANDSVVTLTGTVSEWSHRSLAEETVGGLPGVKRVDNKLEAKSGRPAQDSDAWIGMKVKTMLMFHRNVSGFGTGVDVKKGVVTLSGEAPSEAQKELTAEYVKDIEGVKLVKNNMTVEKKEKSVAEKVGESIDDVSVTSLVKIALLFHRSTSVLNTKVVTNNGIVTVSGVAKNSAEKDLVGKLVNDIQGVKGLKNEMTIE
jgi:hyperosmotically inducible periplasmic protein